MNQRNSTTPPPGMSDPLTPYEVASLFAVDPRTVRRWHDDGKITAVRTPGGHRRFPWAQFPPMLAPAAPPHAAEADAAAMLRVGTQFPQHLTGAPEAVTTPEDDPVTLILGRTRDGRPITLLISRPGWLDELETAIKDARAAADGLR